MLLIAASASVLRAFHVAPVENTPIVPTCDWYRFWRVDARKFSAREEIMLFTNTETLYSFVVDVTSYKKSTEFIIQFLFRYGQLFNGHYGYAGRITEQIMIHRAVDRSLIALMNNNFDRIRSMSGDFDCAQIETNINSIPVLSRGIIPQEYLQQKLSQKQ